MCPLKDSFTYRQKKQKPQIDFLRFLCYNIGAGLFLHIKENTLNIS